MLDSEYETLLFHTEVRWLSKGNMLERFFELREELKVFFIETKMQRFLEDLCDQTFEVQLAYLVDAFGYLNQLNLQLQGSESDKLKGVGNIFVFEDKLHAFLCKLDLWIKNIEEQNFKSFPTLKHLADDKCYASHVYKILPNILTHLGMLKAEFSRYFPEYDKETQIIKKMIRNPFSCNVTDVPDDIQEELIELQNDNDLKDTFESGTNLEELWCRKAISYPNVREIALRYLVLFSTTYLCEQGFSTLLLIKNKQRNRLSFGSDLRLALTIHRTIHQEFLN